MTKTSRTIQGVAAGLGVFLVDIWPVLLIWQAGASGSVGDLSEMRFLWIGVVYAIVVGLLVGGLMTKALRLADAAPRLGRLDPWGAYAVGIGVYNLALTALPAVMFVLLLTDENKSLRDRAWLVYLLWIGGHVIATIIGIISARLLLGRSLHPPAEVAVRRDRPMR